MTRGNQRELAPQKNMKKQNNSVKGKRPDDRLFAAAHKQRDSEIMPQKQKRQMRRRRNPGSFVASCPALFALRLCAWSQSHHAAFSPVVPVRSSTDVGIPFALSLQRAPFVLPTPQVASLPGPLLGVRGLPFSQCFLFLWGSPQSIKSSFVIQIKEKKLIFAVVLCYSSESFVFLRVHSAVVAVDRGWLSLNTQHNSTIPSVTENEIVSFKMNLFILIEV